MIREELIMLDNRKLMAEEWNAGLQRSQLEHSGWKAFMGKKF